MAGVLACVLAWPVADPTAGGPPTGDGAPANPDTMAYCLHLASKVEAMARLRPQVPPDITDLIAQGRTLCSAGHIRPGIHRERWALKELRGE